MAFVERCDEGRGSMLDRISARESLEGNSKVVACGFLRKAYDFFRSEMEHNLFDINKSRLGNIVVET